MLRAGDDYLASIRDGRRVYIGSELVRDVTRVGHAEARGCKRNRKSVRSLEPT
jgi:hypothetical protein